MSGSISIASATCGPPPGGSRRALLGRRLGGRLGRCATCARASTCARQEHDEQRQADRGRRDQDEPERIGGTTIVARRTRASRPQLLDRHGLDDDDLGRRAADHPGRRTGHRDGDELTVDVDVTVEPARSVSAAGSPAADSPRRAAARPAGDERSAVAGDHPCFGPGVRPQRSLERQRTPTTTNTGVSRTVVNDVAAPSSPRSAVPVGRASAVRRHAEPTAPMGIGRACWPCPICVHRTRRSRRH